MSGDVPRYYDNVYSNREYSNMSDLIKFESNYSNVFSIERQDNYGGVIYRINPGHELTALMDQMKVMIKQEQEEQHVREISPFVKDLYEQYKTGLILAKQDLK